MFVTFMLQRCFVRYDGSVFISTPIHHFDNYRRKFTSFIPNRQTFTHKNAAVSIILRKFALKSITQTKNGKERIR